VGAAVVLNVAVCAYAYRLALRHGLIKGVSCRAVLALWALLAGCMAGFVFLVVPREGASLSRPVLVLGALLYLPLARFALPPLALDWNRHR
jgi:hypothetical protein